MHKVLSTLILPIVFQASVYAQNLNNRQCERVETIAKEAEVLYTQFKDTTSALTLMQNSEFGRMLHAKPDCFETDRYLAHLNRYSFYLSQSEGRQNVRFLEGLISRYPENAPSYLYLGHIYKEMSQNPRMPQFRQKAVEAYETYTALCKKNGLPVDPDAAEFLKNGGLQRAEETWGKYLNPKNDVPANRFKAFYINTNDPKNVIASETVEMISVNYPYNKFHDIDSQDFGAYWVGNYTFNQETGMQINISQSWAKTRVIIDGLIIYEGGNNAEIPFTFKKGTHKIEVEFMNNWHTTDFSVVIMPAQKRYKQDELQQALKLGGDFDVWYVGIYESRQKDHSVDLVLKKSHKPVVLLLQSYETTIWKIKNPFKTEIAAVIVGRSKPGSKVLGEVPEAAVYYADWRLGSHDLHPKCSCHTPQFHCEGGNVLNTNKSIEPLLHQRINGFNGQYGVTEMVVPEIVLDAQKYAEITGKIEEIERQREECSKKTDPNFNQIFK